MFFSTEDPQAGLLATFATFGVAFLARPFGAVLLGNLGDRIGRRAVLSGVVLTISVGTALIGLLPGYATIGLWAPLLLVIIRALQGFTAGGEFGGSVAFIIEFAPKGKRGRYGSWQTATVALGSAVAALAVVIVTSVLSNDDVLAWGWRIPFVLALPLGIVGLVLRLRMEDTPDYQRVRDLEAASGKKSEVPVVQAFRRHWRSIAIGALIVVGGTVSTYVFQNYIPTFLNTTDGVPLRVEQFGNMIGLIVYGASALLWGALSDRYGKRPFVVGGAISLFVLMLPLFLMMRTGNGLLIALALSIFGLAASAIMGIVPVLLADFFPTEVRMSGLSISYTIANALFGGTAPFVVLFLVGVTASPNTAVFYCMAAVVVTFVGATLLRHRKGSPESTGLTEPASS